MTRRTIKICNLNRPQLAEERSKLLYHLHNYQEKLNSAIIKYDKSDTENKKSRRIGKLMDSIDVIETLMKKNQKFSGLCRNFVKKCSPYEQAKNRINKYKNDHPKHI